MTRDQRRHIRDNLDDLLRRRYSPSVPKDAFRVEFHPVWDSADGPAPVVSDDEDPLDGRRHALRTGALCWCDRQALAQIKGGHPPRRFIVDIRVAAPRYHGHEGDQPATDAAARIKTLYADEVGCVCVRKGPENTIPSLEETIDEVEADFSRLWARTI